MPMTFNEPLFVVSRVGDAARRKELCIIHVCIVRSVELLYKFSF
jgi:hypothetical protein